MSPLTIILYEIFYTIIYLGLLFSKSTFLKYFPDLSIITRILLLIILFSGFFIPYYLKLLRIRLTVTHYVSIVAFLCLMYMLSSWCYYSTELRERKFHSFLQIPPFEQKVEVAKPAGVFRILCLGGSTTEGPAGRKGYADPLKEMLSTKYPRKRIEVINAGRFFYSTQHSIIQYLFYLKDLNPDLIIVFHGINDLITSFTMPPFSSSPFREDYGHFYGALANVRYPKTFEEFLAGFFYADLLAFEVKPASFSDFKSQNSFRRNVETIIEITKCEGIHLILSNQAHCFSERNDSEPSFLAFPKYYLIDSEHYADEKSWYEGMELFNRITEETAIKFSIPFVDQAAALRGRKEVFRDSVHMMHEGTELLARLFFEKVVQLKLLEETGD